METPSFRASAREARLPTPVGARRFVIRATHERGVGVPSSRSLATASREARSLYGNEPTLRWTEDINREEAHHTSALTWFNPSIAHHINPQLKPCFGPVSGAPLPKRCQSFSGDTRWCHLHHFPHTQTSPRH